MSSGAIYHFLSGLKMWRPTLSTTAQIWSRQPISLAQEASYQNLHETDNHKIRSGKLSGAGAPGAARRQVVTMALQERCALPL